MAVLFAAGSGKSSAAASCAKGSVAATIGGKHACLKVGQRCRKAFDGQYRRYKFQCVAGRLRRLAPVPQTPVTIRLNQVDGSGVTGTATLRPMDASHVRVTLELVNVPPGDLPAHIHFDTCANPSSIRYGLSNVVNGKSESEVFASIAYLRRGHGRFSINVHKADPDLPIIACGDIPPA